MKFSKGVSLEVNIVPLLKQISLARVLIGLDMNVLVEVKELLFIDFD